MISQEHRPTCGPGVTGKTAGPRANLRLSIAIPTYNGANTIRETLSSILPQVEPCVELVISDNCSTDHTQKVVSEYREACPSMRYYRNKENLGADRNCDLAVRRSCGEYVWLVSDDDKLVSGAVRKVLDVLDRYDDVALVFVNWSTYTVDFGSCVKEKALDIAHDVFCGTADDFLRMTRNLASYLSSSIVRRDLWERTDISRFLGTNWLQYAARLSLLRGRAAVCVAAPLVMYRSGAMRWEQDGMLLINSVNLVRIVRSLRSLGYAESSVGGTLDAISANLPLTVIGSKLSGLVLTPALLADVVTTYCRYPAFWFLALPLVLLPRSLHRLGWKLYQVPRVKRCYKRIQWWLGHTPPNV